MGTLSHSCPHCLHDKSLFECCWADQHPPNPVLWQAYLLCSHCHLGIGIMFYAKKGTAPHSPHALKGDLARTFDVFKEWPERKSISAPSHTPSAIAKRYIEGENAFARKSWNSAVAMYRSALDIATKAMEPEAASKKFFARLKWMYENGKITKEIREWADKVRVEGNDALHDPEEFTEKDAVPLRFFTEMFLRYVFELPGEVERLRREDKSAKETP